MSFARQPSALDRLLAGQASPAKVAQELIAEARQGLEAFCDIPAAYQHCQLEVLEKGLNTISAEATKQLIDNPSGAIINPMLAHKQSIEFFQKILAGDPLVCDENDPLRPALGAYLVGPPGVGKTHIMAAFGLKIKQRLDSELKVMEAQTTKLVQQIYETTLYQQVDWAKSPISDTNRWVLDAPSGDIKAALEQAAPATERGKPARVDFWKLAQDSKIKLVRQLPPEERFAAALRYLRNWVATYRYQPTDMMYLGFEGLFDLQKDPEHRQKVFSALEMARIVFIDDIHPKGDPERLQVIQQLIERRYELDRPGTFITTNLLTEQLSGDQNISQRLLSRCSENFIKFNFDDCQDWRVAVKSRRIEIIRGSLKG